MYFVNTSNEILLFLISQKHSLDAIVAGCNFLCKRSRARGVENIKHTIPMLGGDHFFCDSHARWGRQFWFFQHLCGESAWKYAFLKISNGIFDFLFFCYSPARGVAALFLTRCENVLPTLRGVHFFISLVHRQVVDRSACVYAFWKMRFPHCVAFTFLFHLCMTGCLLRHVLFMRLGIVLPTLRGVHFFHVISYSLQVIKSVASLDVISSRFRFHFTMYVCTCLCSICAAVRFIRYTL